MNRNNRSAVLFVNPKHRFGLTKRTADLLLRISSFSMKAEQLKLMEQQEALIHSIQEMQQSYTQQAQQNEKIQTEYEATSANLIAIKKRIQEEKQSLSEYVAEQKEILRHVNQEIAKASVKLKITEPPPYLNEKSRITRKKRCVCYFTQ